MKFFLLLFLKVLETRHHAVVGYAFVDASVMLRPWPLGHLARQGASTPFGRHARYRLDLASLKSTPDFRDEPIIFCQVRGAADL